VKATEHDVQEFYDSALHAYQALMGDRWHHGDPDAEDAGHSAVRACEILEERIVALAGLTAGGKALDFGSGIGGPTCHMAKVSGASFVGVTNNDRLNTVAREKARSLGLAERVTFKTLSDTGYKSLSDPDNEGFPPGTLDVVTFYESICHVPEKKVLFRELARLLKPGGRLAGTDWIQRPYGENQSYMQIMKYMGLVNEHIAIPAHGTLESYAQMMDEAGLKVCVARDLFQGVKCWGSTPKEQTSEWLEYKGPEQEKFRKGKQALDAAREAGVFSVGMWVAMKPR
jgi:tocopherol O-methyltransferase